MLQPDAAPAEPNSTTCAVAQWAVGQDVFPGPPSIGKGGFVDPAIPTPFLQYCSFCNAIWLMPLTFRIQYFS